MVQLRATALRLVGSARCAPGGGVGVDPPLRDPPSPRPHDPAQDRRTVEHHAAVKALRSSCKVGDAAAARERAAPRRTSRGRGRGACPEGDWARLPALAQGGVFGPFLQHGQVVMLFLAPPPPTPAAAAVPVATPSLDDRITALVSAGKCGQAKAEATKAGNDELARQVGEVCTRPSSPDRNSQGGADGGGRRGGGGRGGAGRGPS